MGSPDITTGRYLPRKSPPITHLGHNPPGHYPAITNNWEQKYKQCMRSLYLPERQCSTFEYRASKNQNEIFKIAKVIHECWKHRFVCISSMGFDSFELLRRRVLLTPILRHSHQYPWCSLYQETLQAIFSNLVGIINYTLMWPDKILLILVCNIFVFLSKINRLIRLV